MDLSEIADCFSNTRKFIELHSGYFDAFWKKNGKGIFALSFTSSSKELNASAARVRTDGYNAYYVSITNAMFFVAHEYIRVFLSDNNVFQGIGTSSNLLVVPSIRARSFEELISDIENSGPLPSFDENRKKLHYFMFELTLKFVMLHEFTHIIHGHTDLGYEYKFDKQEVMPKLDIQTLELDADAKAILNLRQECLNRMYDDPIVPDQLRDEKKISYCLSFCHLLSMATMSYYSMSAQLLYTSDHPNPFMRHMGVLFTLASSYINNEETLNLVMDASQDALKDFIDTHKRVIEDDNFEEFDWTFIKEETAHNHLKVIAMNWDNLIPKLEKYAMVPLPPKYNE